MNTSVRSIRNLKRLAFSAVGLLTALLINNPSAGADPALIQVQGATSSQLRKVRGAMEKAAYGTPSAATAPVAEDACEFYKPPQKLRLLKRMPATDLCQGKGDAVIAHTESAVIFLCKDGVTVADYDFSMGRNGVDKRVLGDLKTPIGRYPIDKPRASDLFKVFIPIGYPTPEQSKEGYSGSDIGIHGPSRAFRCAGFLNVVVDWTQGCLAVSSDIFVKEIARFVELNSIRTITIH